jgi:phosphoribosylglycinamide formyltransferase-1
MKTNLVILASGNGTNAERLISYFERSETIQVSAVLSNKKDAYALTRARNFGVASEAFSREEFLSERFFAILKSYNADYIILAGFLWKIPDYLIKAFLNKIINIHPSLLPKHGGKGMFGAHIHEAVISEGESVSGITIHLVNEHYDEGRILFQASCDISAGDSADSLAEKIHHLEHRHFPEIVADYIRDRS